MHDDPHVSLFSFGFRCTNNDNINTVCTLWKIENYKDYNYKTLFGYRLQFYSWIKEFRRWKRVTVEKFSFKPIAE